MKKQKVRKIVSLVLAVVMCSLLWLPAFAVETQPRMTVTNGINIPTVGQGSGTNLCWAASGASVTNYLKGTSYTANSFMSAVGGTNASIYPNQLKSHLSSMGVSSTLVSGTIIPSSLIINQIDSGKPIIALCDISGSNYAGTAHFVVIYGYTYNDTHSPDTMTIMYMDPAGSGSRQMKSYANFTQDEWVMMSYLYNLSA